MTNTWTTFLRTQGAVFTDGQVSGFGQPAADRRVAHAGDVLVDLTHLAFIRVGGADRTIFLNGQLTNDIQSLDAGHSQLSAWCSSKGRMLALFRVLAADQAYLLQLPALLRDDVIKRLRVFVMRAKVQIEAADDTLVRFGLAGPHAAALLNQAIGPIPNNVNEVSVSAGLTVVRLHGATPRFEIIGAPDDASRLWSALNSTATPASAATWDWLDIVAGIPTVLPPTSDAFVPQMANLDLIDGINFNKGCYTGQEIVARVHYRGRIKQRMYRARVRGTETPLPGDTIFAAERPEQSTGTVVIASASPDDGHDLLAVIHSASVARGDLHLHRPDGPPLTIEPLPYSLPD